MKQQFGILILLIATIALGAWLGEVTRPENFQYQEIMLGEDFMIAPVTDPGVDEVKVYLPRGRWVHLWTGAVHGSEDRGEYVTVPAPVGQPGVFYKVGSQAGVDFVQSPKSQNLLP